MPVILLSFFLMLAPAQVQSTAPGQNPNENQSQTQTAPRRTQGLNANASKAQIRKAQQALKDKGMYMGPIDGRMSADTEQALRNFQQQNNLQATGNLNQETLAALGVTGRQSQKGPAVNPKANHKQNKVQGTSSLSKSEVRQAQIALKQEGFNPGPIDGIMGPRTSTAIRNYQSHSGLQVTGTLTAETQQALLAKGPATASARLKPGMTSQNNSGQTGAMNSGDIWRAQIQLSDLYYYNGPISGTMDQQTEQAIREFQYLNNLPVTGALDQQTQAALSTQWKGGGQNSQLSQTYSQDQTFAQDRSSNQSSDRSYNQDVNREKPGTVQGANSGHDHADAADSETRKDDHADSHNSDAAERIQKSVDVLKDLTSAGDHSIPNYVLDKAEAVAVIPNIVKGALGFGGRYGGGVVSERLTNGSWSAPAFIKVGGGSWGAQIGVSSTDLVLVFTDRDALNMLEGGNGLKLGVDVSAVAGPVGRSAEAGVTGNLKSGVLAYSRAKGLFVGAAVDGAVLHMDGDMNHKVYGKSVDAKQILNGNAQVNSTVRPFVAELQKLVPAKRISQR